MNYSTSNRLSLLALPLVAIVVAVMVFGWGHSTAEPAEATGTMNLVVKAGALGGPCSASSCDVVKGTSFTLSVDFKSPPGGYIGFQTHIKHGAVTYKPTLDAADEITWPDSGFPVRSIDAQSDGAQVVSHGALGSIIPPFLKSNFSGNIVELTLNCTAGNSSTLIELLPFGDPKDALLGILGSSYFPVGFDPDVDKPSPASDAMTVNCVQPPVGGIAVDPDLGTLALETAESSDGKADLFTVLIAAGAGAVIAVGATAWYVRRRIVDR